MKIEIEKILALKSFQKEINSLPLDKIILYYKGKNVKIKPEWLEELTYVDNITWILVIKEFLDDENKIS